MASVTLRTKPINKKGYSIFLDIYNEGIRHKEYLKLYVSKDYTKPENKNVLKQDKEDWELAKAIHAKRLLQVKETVAGFVPRSYQKDFVLYFKEKASEKCNPNYQHALRHLLIFNGTDKLSFKAIDERYLKAFIKYLKDESLNPTTIRLYLFIMQAVLNMAVVEKIIHTNPFSYLRKGKGGDIPVRQQKKLSYLTLAELRKLKECTFREDVKQVFFFSCFTGLRESDILKLKWSNINEGVLSYSQKKQQDALMHYLPLNKQALELLKEIKATQLKILNTLDEKVFAHLPIKRTVLDNLKRWSKQADLNRNLHMHMGRHTYATLALTNGVSLYTVSKMLGHSSIGVTQVYAQIVDEVKQKASELMPML